MGFISSKHIQQNILLLEKKMEEDVCYICSDVKDDVLFKNICKCRDKTIHKTCLEKLIEKVEVDCKCSVCKQKYINISIVNKIKINKYNVLKLAFASFIIYPLIFFFSYKLVLTIYYTSLLHSICIRNITNVTNNTYCDHGKTVEDGLFIFGISGILLGNVMSMISLTKYYTSRIIVYKKKVYINS